MRSLIWLVFAVVLAGCAGQERILPTPATGTQATAAAVRPTQISTAAASTGPTTVAVTSPTFVPIFEPTLAPYSTSTRPAVVLPPITTIPAATRGANAMVQGRGPICKPAANAHAIAEGELGSATKPIVIGLVTYRDSKTTAEAGAELAACLGKINGLTYAVVIGTTPRESVEHLASSTAQVAFLDELTILYGQQEYGFETGLVILRTGQEQLEPFSHREFFANKAVGIKTLADVRGKTFCFGEPGHLMNTTLPQIVLAASGVDPDMDLKAIHQTGFADTIAMAVYRGECDAGSGYRDILTFPGEALQTYPNLADKVETIYLTDPIPNDGVQYARDLDARIREATTTALLTMAGDNPGKHPPLVTLYKIEGFVRAGNEFYDEFRALVKRAGVDLAEVVR